jgi:GT2 family glycosyltransferase/glycosyltransferase involved in cell wall biosynthesis
MRVLNIVHGFPPAAVGGTELYARSHAVALQTEYGDDVVVLTREQDETRPEHVVRSELRDGLRVVWINNTFRSTRTFEETYRNPTIDAIASRVIDDFKPDVAHIHHLTCLSTTIVKTLAARKIPCFVTLHDYWLICHRGQLLDTDYKVCDGPEPSGCRKCLGLAGSAGAPGFLGALAVRVLERRLPHGAAHRMRRAAEGFARLIPSLQDSDEPGRRLKHMREVCADVTHFLAPSRDLRDRFVRFGIAPEKITVARNGIDASRGCAVSRTSSARLRLGFVGSLMVSKGPHLLLEAFAKLPRGAASVDLYGSFAPYHGDDSYRVQLEPLLRQDGVRSHGSIAHDDVAEALSGIDVLVVPSIWPENSPLVVQEAFVAGIPVVASRIGGIPELVEDGRNGLLFRAGDASDLARVLARLIHEPGLLARLGTARTPVRLISEDVRAVRSMYEAHLAARHLSPPGRLAGVVLNFRTPDDTLLAVKSLLASRRPFDDIFVVDNEPSDTLRDALQALRRPTSYLRTGSNVGFSAGMNAGIREALRRGADRVLLVNSDAIVPPDCAGLLERCLDRSAGAGIAGPTIRSRSEPDRIESLGMVYTRATGRMRQERVAAAALDGPATDRVVDAVTGCVMLVDRRVFDAIGLLDEDYFFSFEDLDFCLRAHAAGFASVLAGGAAVYHESAKSIGATSPRRLYFSARGQLLAAKRSDPMAGRLATYRRTMSIVALNLAHAIRSPGGTAAHRVGAVLRGTRDYFLGRFGADG